MAEVCTGTTAAGAPCAAQAWRDGLCRWHHPDLEARLAALGALADAGGASAWRAGKGAWDR